MSAKERMFKALALLIPTGVIGISSALASVQTQAEPMAADLTAGSNSVAQRLSDIRSAVSTANNAVIDDASGAKLVLADWVNWGGRGLGWGNGGWHNWGNGWHNGGWGNGGWHNWGNGWHNWGNGGWHNFWHNW
jgi:rSAM-associated Gly-rich repeat protein